MTAKKYLTPKEVSDMYGFSLGTLANWRWKRIGPRFDKCGRMVLYAVSDIENFIRSRPVLTMDSLHRKHELAAVH